MWNQVLLSVEHIVLLKSPIELKPYSRIRIILQFSKSAVQMSQLLHKCNDLQFILL